jgi:hypothetical protein
MTFRSVTAAFVGASVAPALALCVVVASPAVARADAEEASLILEGGPALRDPLIRNHAEVSANFGNFGSSWPV